MTVHCNASEAQALKQGLDAEVWREHHVAEGSVRAHLYFSSSLLGGWWARSNHDHEADDPTDLLRFRSALAVKQTASAGRSWVA